jgi:hypothetical protein
MWKKCKEREAALKLIEVAGNVADAGKIDVRV